MTSAILEVAQEMPEHQTSRGREFHNLTIDQYWEMARNIVIARSQANASNAAWDRSSYRSAMRRKKNGYLYQAGELSIDMKEAKVIWWSMVHDDPSPSERRAKDLI